MAYPRVAAGLEYRDKVSHCPQEKEKKKGGEEISFDTTGKSWRVGGGGLQDCSRSQDTEKYGKNTDDILVVYFHS